MFNASSDDIEQVRKSLGAIHHYPSQWEIQFAEDVLVPLYNIAQLGARFQSAWKADWKNTLFGTLLGMAGSATGAFLIIDLFHYLGNLHCPDSPFDMSTCRPTTEWGSWRGEVGSEAFQVGLAMGELGMGVSQMILAAPVVAGSKPSLGWGPPVVASTSTLGGTLVLQGVFPLAVVQELEGYLQGALGGYGTWMAMSGEPPDDSNRVSNSVDRSIPIEDRLDELADRISKDVPDGDNFYPHDWEIMGEPQYGGALQNPDPTGLIPTEGSERWYITYRDNLGNQHRISVNYNPATGQFGNVKRSSWDDFGGY